MKDEVAVSFESGAIVDANEVRVRHLYGREQIGQLYEFEIHLICSNTDGIDDRALLSSAACIVFTRSSADGADQHEQRRIYGVVATVRDRCFTESRHREYIVRFVPRAWRLGLTLTTDIYMDMSVKDIVQRKLEDAGLAAADMDFRIMGGDAPREFVVQYQETDLAFVSRLVEDAGIAFYFEQDDDKRAEVIVFSDNNDAFEEISPAVVPFAPRGDRINVFELEATRRLITTDFKARDYNYRNPSMDLLGEAKLDALGGGVSNEYGDHVKTPDEAHRVAQIRAEEMAVDHYNLHGRGDVPQFRAGGTVTIENHPHSAAGELLLVEVTHEIEQTAFGTGDGTAEHYHCDFRAIPLSAPFRPPRITPKPTVAGVLTGLVDHPTETEHGPLDAEGRYRITFMYDSVTEREPGKASRSVRMAQPSGGPDRGMHIPLRSGTEVILTCVNGDPDRPIIVGAVPNPQTYSPVNSSNAEKSVLKVNKSMLAFDDRDARVKLTVGDEHAEENVLQIGAPNAGEQGVFIGTIANATTIANGVLTTIGDDYASFSNGKVDLCSNNVIAVAGQAHPMGYWTKGEKLAKDVIKWGKMASAALDSYQTLATLPAKEKKAKAEKKLAKAKADDAKNSSAETKKDVAKAEADVAAKDLALTKAEESSGQLVAGLLAGTIGDVVAATEKGVEFLDGVIKPLHSLMSKMTSSLLSGLMHGVAKDAHERMTQAVKDAEERVEADLGKFAKAPGDDDDDKSKISEMAAKAEGEALHLNASTHTAAVFSEKNAFFFGMEHATLGSDEVTSVVSGETLNIKAVKDIEMAAVEAIKITASKLLDLQSDKEIKIVGHDGEDDASIPSGTSVFLFGEKHIYVDSKDGAFLHGKSTSALAAGGSSGFGVYASDSKVHLGALGSADSPDVSGKDESTVKVEDGKIKLEGGGAEVTLDGKIKMDGDKIQLG
jgi:type VI secretion system VgrG family protein